MSDNLPNYDTWKDHDVRSDWREHKYDDDARADEPAAEFDDDEARADGGLDDDVDDD